MAFESLKFERKLAEFHKRHPQLKPVPTEATVRHALGVRGYSLTVTFESESQERGRVRPWQYPRPAPEMRAWVPTNVRGGVEQVVIVPRSM